MDGYTEELTLKVAFSMLPGATRELYSRLENCGVNLEDFFRQSAKSLTQSLDMEMNAILGDGCRQEAYVNARKETEFMQRHHISGYFLTDDDYPWRLLDMTNPPLLLYKLGTCSLNQEHSLSVVGTRHCTAYGVEHTRSLVKDLGEYFPDLCIVSGLAYGIDATAHTSALEARRSTIAVVAHGLHMIYPAAHRQLAENILRSGGAIVSEYTSGSTPYRNRFLERNRIVACISSGVVVAESDLKGGAMSTAHDAFTYSRDVMAFPGRVTDQQSRGTNHLIRNHKAQLITDATDVIDTLGWQPAGIRIEARQRCLFPELEGDSRQIYDALRFAGTALSLDALHTQTKLPIGQIMAAMSEMEFDGIVCRQPGNRYTVG
ncbi:MAG: DNA-processing protein DprA [Clostridium sp.]|nr:DNA-processing protein DprA [Prevotella sp.]MCM1429775.1 DNA-processing protein DprA [Clostridium sp.]